MTPKFERKLLFCKNSLGGDKHSHERLIVITVIITIIFIIIRWLQKQN